MSQHRLKAGTSRRGVTTEQIDPKPITSWKVGITSARKELRKPIHNLQDMTKYRENEERRGKLKNDLVTGSKYFIQYGEAA